MTMDWMADEIVYEIFPGRFAAHPDGALFGIAEKLAYLQDLGATTLYLTPIFSSPSDHKYDTVDYHAVDPQFGGDEGLDRLLSDAHARGMKVVLDVSINHTSDRHPWRATNPEYYLRDGDGGTCCWRGHRHMPELDLTHPDLRRYFYEDHDSVLQRWLARDADGWRLDCSPDLGRQVAREMRGAVEKRFPSAVLIGETWCFGGDWAGPDGYHGVMNYFFRDLVLGWLQGDLRAEQTARGLEEAGRCEGALASWNMLASHDTPRLATVLPAGWRRWLAMVAQFTLPGVPVIYYGEEIGMQGGADPDCRRPMVWEPAERDEGLRRAWQALMALRRERHELRRGALRMLSPGMASEALIFLRHTEVPGEAAVVGLNPTEETVRRKVVVPYSHLYHALPLRDRLECAPPLEMESGTVGVELPPRGAAVWVPDDGTYRRYRFFKGR